MPRITTVIMMIAWLILTDISGIGYAQPDDLPPIIFVKQTPVNFTHGSIADIFGNHRGRVPTRAQPTGGGLYRLDPDGTVTNLTPFDDIAVRDPEVSYDGTRVIFAMKQGGFGNWQLYDMNVDGSDMRRISRVDATNDWDPAYMPDGRIVFLSDRLLRLADIQSDALPEGQLVSMNRDGSDLQLINANRKGTFNPQVGQNGLIYFTQWDLNEEGSALDISRFLIWEAFQDGSREGHPIFGQHVVEDFAGGFTEARELPDGSGDMIAVFAQTRTTWGAGSIVRVTPRGDEDLHQPQWLTSPDAYSSTDDHSSGRYRSPYPLLDGRIVASFAPDAVWVTGDDTDVPDFDLVMLDDDGGHRIIHTDPNYWDWQAVEVTPRPIPQMAIPLTNPEFEYAIINSMDVELRHIHDESVVNGDHQPSVEEGEAAAVRIYALLNHDPPYGLRSVEEVQRDLSRRLLGEVPIAEDGSFAAVVPARTLLIWETVNANGEVLVSERYWSELAPGEVRTCGGCHTPHGGGDGRSSNVALLNPVNLTGREVDQNMNELVDLLESLPREPVISG